MFDQLKMSLGISLLLIIITWIARSSSQDNSTLDSSLFITTDNMCGIGGEPLPGKFSYMECQNRCAEDEDCEAADYEYLSRRCVIYMEDTERQGYSKSSYCSHFAKVLRDHTGPVASGDCSMSLIVGFGSFGGLLQGSWSKDEFSCTHLCLWSPNCAAARFDLRRSQCFFYSIIPVTHNDSCCHLYYKTCAGCTLTVLNDVKVDNSKEVLSASSHLDCQQFCLMLTHCTFASFDQVAQKCYYSTNYVADVLTDITSTTYKRVCRHCENDFEKANDRSALGGTPIVYATSAEQCKIFCRNTARCEAFDFNTAPTTNYVFCYIHTKIVHDIYNRTGFDHYSRRQCSGCFFQRSINTYAYGGQLVRGVNSEEECKKRCHKYRTCLAVTFDRIFTECLFHIKLHSGLRIDSCCVHYTKICPDSMQYKTSGECSVLELKRSYAPGGELQGIMEESDCVTICLKLPNCEQTHFNHNNKTCYFHRNKVTTVSSIDSITYIKQCKKCIMNIDPTQDLFIPRGPLYLKVESCIELCLAYSSCLYLRFDLLSFKCTPLEHNLAIGSGKDALIYNKICKDCVDTFIRVAESSPIEQELAFMGISDFRTCYNQCVQVSQCRAFSFINKNSSAPALCYMFRSTQLQLYEVSHTDYYIRQTEGCMANQTTVMTVVADSRSRNITVATATAQESRQSGSVSFKIPGILVGLSILVTICVMI